MTGRGLYGTSAAVGVGLVQYKRGTAPQGERGLLVRAMVAACDDAGIDPAGIDGFVSYGNDHNPPDQLMGELGTRELHFSSMVWGAGGGGLLAAFEQAAMAIATGQAEVVAVYRAISQGTSGRLANAVIAHHVSDHAVAAGVVTPAIVCALRAQRMLIEHDLQWSAIEALVQADYYHGSRNPEAVAYGKPLDLDTYRKGRKITGPLRLYDCSRESDGAGVVLMTSTELARDLRKRPVYLLGAAHGAEKGWGNFIENDLDYASSGFTSVARRLWDRTGLGPKDIDVTQLYENFTPQAVVALVDHGLTSWETIAEDMIFENLIAPNGRMPVNTDGGNLARGFVHGINIAVEAVRQLRGESSNSVPDARTCLVTGGPGSRMNSSAVFANEFE